MTHLKPLRYMDYENIPLPLGSQVPLIFDLVTADAKLRLIAQLRSTLPLDPRFEEIVERNRKILALSKVDGLFDGERRGK